MLQIKNISKYFDGIKALDQISFGVTAGTIQAVIGPNGAGKTTFYNVLTGIYPLTSGEISFEARNISHLQPWQITPLGMARTFQNLRLFPHMSVLENIMVGAFFQTRYHLYDAFFQTKRFRHAEIALLHLAHHLARRVGIINKDNELAKNLSYGEQKRLEIARALAGRPKLLLLDEPVAGMNAKETEETITLIKSIKAEGVTILLIEHDMKMVMQISDHIVVLDHGIKIAQGTPSEIRQNPQVIEAYLGSSAYA